MQTTDILHQYPNLPAEIVGLVTDARAIWPTIESVLFDELRRSRLLEIQYRFVVEDRQSDIPQAESPIRAVIDFLLNDRQRAHQDRKRQTVLRILRAMDDPVLFETWRASEGFAAGEANPLYGSFSRNFFPLHFGNSRQDVSFVIANDERPLLLVLATIGQGNLDYFGLPVRLVPQTALDDDAMAKATNKAFDHLDDLSSEHSVRQATIHDAGVGHLSAVGQQCLNRHFLPAVRLTALADLTNGESGLRRALRKSYKSYLNWGKSNLTTHLVDAKQPDRDLFSRYQQFHQTIAGRVTRPQAAWMLCLTGLRRATGNY